MKSYWHMMEQVTLSDRKKEEIMEMLENKGTQKRRMPRAGKLILAAALAVGCVLSIAAGLPAKVYHFATGSQFYMMPGTDKTGMTVGDVVAPVKAEGGRLWFEADGQKIDITDQVDENTPYIYERSDPATGEKGYIIAGGTVENFGWIECAVIDGKIAAGTEQNARDTRVTLPDGSKVPFAELTDAQRAELADEDGGIYSSYANYPWLDAALDQLSQLDLADAHDLG